MSRRDLITCDLCGSDCASESDVGRGDLLALALVAWYDARDAGIPATDVVAGWQSHEAPSLVGDLCEPCAGRILNGAIRAAIRCMAPGSRPPISTPLREALRRFPLGGSADE